MIFLWWWNKSIERLGVFHCIYIYKEHVTSLRTLKGEVICNDELIYLIAQVRSAIRHI